MAGHYNALIRPVSNYASVLWTNCDKEIKALDGS